MYLVQGQRNNPFQLSLFAVDPRGWLYEPRSVTFRILGPDGVQIFPSDGVADVTHFPFDDGHYYAVDPNTGEGWAVPEDAALGRYTIVWSWTPLAKGGGREVRRHFWVESGEEYEGLGWWTYLAPTRVREEGITEAELPPSRLETLLTDAQDYIEQSTANVFRPVPQDFRMDGNHGHTLFLGLPIIGVRGVYANNSSHSVSPSSLHVNHARVDQEHRYRVNPDPRRNPHISLRVGLNGRGSQYNWPDSFGSARFVAGVANQRIDGVFGFVEPDGTVPRLIQEAMLRLVVANTEPLEVGVDEVSGPISSQTTDRNSVTYAVARSPEGRLTWAGATSKRVEEILVRYRRPMIMKSTTATRVWG